MSFTLKAIASVLLLVTFNLSLVSAKLLKSGDITKSGQVNTGQGRRQYFSTAHVTRSILSWEDLDANGVTVETCTSDVIRFNGNIDKSDFVEGIVLTFPKEDYLAMGCPKPPITDALSKVDQVVFREITSTTVEKNGVVVMTKYISGAKVVPEVELHVGELLPTARQLSSNDGTDIFLNELSRASIGVDNFNRQGSYPLFTGAKVDWSFSVSAGVSEFKFSRTKLRASWNQGLSADATATLDFDRQVKKTADGEIFKTAIPSAGFTINIFLIGRVSAGLFAGINYEASIEAGAAATATFSAGIDAGQKVSVGISGFDVNAQPSSGRSGTATLNFKNPSGSASAFVEGFVGLRPFIEAGLELPIVGDANVDVGATVGLNANVQFNTVPFRPVVIGRTIGVCKNCHSVQGSLEIEGRRLSVSAKLPGLSRKEKVIRSKFLDYHIGTLCLFTRTCPVASPTPSPAPGTAACKCKCGSIGAAVTQCTNRIPACRVSQCQFGPVTQFRCCAA